MFAEVSQDKHVAAAWKTWSSGVKKPQLLDYNISKPLWQQTTLASVPYWSSQGKALCRLHGPQMVPVPQDQIWRQRQRRSMCKESTNFGNLETWVILGVARS